jgi:hypothetical protein
MQRREVWAWSLVCAVLALNGCDDDRAASTRPDAGARYFGVTADPQRGDRGGAALLDAGLMPTPAPPRTAADAGARDAASSPSERSTPMRSIDDDAGPAADGGGCAPFTMPKDCPTQASGALPAELRCTGLYGDWAARRVACGVTPYALAYLPWSDGAVERRWFSLPEGTHVDASRPDAFQFPVGAQFWQELRVPDGAGTKLVETRLSRKLATPKASWLYTSYVWDERGETALQTNDGVKAALGTDHDVPNIDQCRRCHEGREDFILGWDTLMLAPDLPQLTAAGVIADQPDRIPAIPGSPTDAAALAYLHVNCGVSCHNPTGDAKDSGLFMRLDFDKLTQVTDTPTIATGLMKTPWKNAKIQSLNPPTDSPYYDILPNRTDASLIYLRMNTRGTEAQMPPIGSNKVDLTGLELVRKLIED